MNYLLIALSLVTFSSFSTEAQAAACPSNLAASCNFSGQPICVDLVQGAMSVSDFQQACEGEGAVFSASPCQSGAVGTCTAADALLYRLYSPVSAGDVNAICGQNQMSSCQ